MLKAYASVWLLFCHTAFAFHLTGVKIPGSGFTWDMTPCEYALICGLCFVGAQSLMLSMGIGMAFSKRKSAAHYASRGVSLVLLNFLLIFFRCVVPRWVFGGHSLVYTDADSWWSSLLASDILLFAGLAFLFFAVAKLLRFRLWTLVVAALACFAVHEWLSPHVLAPFLPWKSYTLEEKLAIGWFVGAKEGGSGFPVLCWLIYPVLGLCLGNLLRHCTNKGRFYAAVLGVSACAFGALWFFHRDIWTVMADHYYVENWLSALAYLFIEGVWFSLAYFLSVPLKRTAFWKVVVLGSQSMTAMFCFSWILLGWAAGYMYVHRIWCPREWKWYIAASLAVVALSAGLTFLSRKLTARRAAAAGA